ncbi:MAG: MBL fold metallo-hydrolase, partial [Actinobacteria bacterium]|nr:MBL fold metallo-hydrolase [Actinomycetota bacterium]
MSIRIYDVLEVGPLHCNCYIVGDEATKQALIIDPGGDTEIILDSISRNGLNVVGIVATHAHFDHITAAEQIRIATGAPFSIHADDVDMLGWMSESMQMFLGIQGPPPPGVDRMLAEGGKLTVGDSELEVLHTPGHTEGSISLVTNDMVFS